MDKYDYLLQNVFGDLETEERVKKLLNSDFSRVDFTYSKEELDKIIQDYIQKQELKDKQEYRVIEDYDEDALNSSDSIEVANEVNRFMNLIDKDDIEEVDSIISVINSKYDPRMNMPVEVLKTIKEIKEHYDYLLSLKLKERVAENKKEEEKLEEVQEQENTVRESEKIEESKMQQDRINEVQSKLPIINEKIRTLRGKITDQDKMIQLLKERTYFYNNSNITVEDIERLNNYIDELDNLEKSFTDEKKDTIDPVELSSINGTEVEEPIFDMEGLEEIFEDTDKMIKSGLKESIAEYDKKMDLLMEGIKPYMYREDVSREMKKVADYNNEANNLVAKDTIEDYRKAAEKKKMLVEYLERANAFIDERNKENEEKNKTEEPVYDDMLQMKNDDGTYTIEYMAHLATIAGEYGGKEMAQKTWNQLLEYNKMVQAGEISNNNELDEMMDEIPLINGSADLENRPRELGFAVFYILAYCIAISSIILVLVSMFIR